MLFFRFTKQTSKNVADATFKDFYNKSYFPSIIEFSDNYDDTVIIIDVNTVFLLIILSVTNIPANIYWLKVNNRNTRKKV